MSRKRTFFGKVGRLRQSKIREFEQLYANPRPQVIQALHECHLQNFSVFREGEVVFTYFEYVGDCYEFDMEALANNEMMQRWWLFVKTCFEKLGAHAGNEYCLERKQIFHLD